MNSSWLVLARVLAVVVRAAYVVTLARFLGPKLYGIFAYSQSWYMVFLAFTSLGLGSIVSREVGKNRNKGATVVAQALMLRSICAVIAAILCAIIGIVTEVDPFAHKLLLIFSFALIGRALSAWAESVFTAYEVTRYTFQQEALFRVFEVLLAFVVLISGGGAIGVASVHALSWWLQGLRGVVLVKQNIVVSFRTKWQGHNILPLLAQGLPVLGGLVLMNWFLQGPIVLFRHSAISDGELGQFALVMQAFMVLCWIPGVAVLTTLPVLTRSVQRNDGKDSLFVDVTLRLGLLLGAVVGLVGLGMGSWIVRMMFGIEYEYAGKLLGPALWLLIPWTLANATWQVLLARGQFILPMLGALIGVIVFSATFSVMVSYMGCYGALLSIGLGMSSWAFILIALFARSSKLKFGLTVFRPAAAVLISLAAYVSLVNISSWIALGVSLLILFGSVYAFGVVTAEERFAIIRFVNMRFKNSKDNVPPGKEISHT